MTLTLEEWLQERLDNARRIADRKTGKDREGWQEDVTYFLQAVRSLHDYDLARQALRNSFPKNQVHEHHCETCGQLRQCHHAQCQYVFLADCDPGYGCKTKKADPSRHLGATES